MMALIKGIGATHGDSEGCVVCHGGSPAETKNKDAAHKGSPAKLMAANGPLGFYTLVRSQLVTRAIPNAWKRC
jgi:hypothetical protein